MNVKELIGSRITEARKAKEITIKELSAKIKTLSATRISNWEQGTRSPGPEEAKLLGQALNVAASWLLGLTDNPQGEVLLNAEKGMRYVPVFGMQEVIGFEIVNKNSFSLIAVDKLNPSVNSKTLFAVKVEDNSMQPDFNPGNIVVVDGERVVRPGDYVLAYLKMKNEVVLRQYGETEGCLFQLLASNELWGRLSVRDVAEVEIIGVGVEVRKDLILDVTK